MIAQELPEEVKPTEVVSKEYEDLEHIPEIRFFKWGRNMKPRERAQQLGIPPEHSTRTRYFQVFKQDNFILQYGALLSAVDRLDMNKLRTAIAEVDAFFSTSHTLKKAQKEYLPRGMDSFNFAPFLPYTLSPRNQEAGLKSGIRGIFVDEKLGRGPVEIGVPGRRDASIYVPISAIIDSDALLEYHFADITGVRRDHPKKHIPRKEVRHADKRLASHR
ncbi:MAG: hypothetical protein OXR66_05500 [Candidatus Woesearchaeota archaeon]|nr:hypothetical protein [Candidatus Woesearchaeota archaeon]